MLKKDLFLSPKLLGMLPGCHGGSRKCLGMLPGCHGSSRKCLGMLPGCHGNSRKYLGMLPGCHGSSRKNLGMLPGSFFADSPSGRVLPYGRWTHASMKSHLPPFGGGPGRGWQDLSGRTPYGLQVSSRVNTASSVTSAASFFVSWRLQGARSVVLAPAPVLLYSA